MQDSGLGTGHPGNPGARLASIRRRKGSGKTRAAFCMPLCPAPAVWGRVEGIAQKKPIPIRNLVMKKSTTTMSTEATTMAWVVARPTPSVPPVVCSPW